MTDRYSDIATKEYAPDPANMLSAPLAGGKVHIVQASVTLAAAPIADVIKWCKLSKGDVVLPIGGIINGALGSGVTLNLGDDDPAGANAARYMAATAMASAAATSLLASGIIGNIPYVVQSNCWLTSTIAGGAATGTVKGFFLVARAGG